MLAELPVKSGLRSYGGLRFYEKSSERWPAFTHEILTPLGLNNTFINCKFTTNHPMIIQ